jgi:hypothetical protein
VAITVAKTKTFYLHFDLLIAESERFSKQLKGNFKEAVESVIELEDEDLALFGFFVEYIYRNHSLLSRGIGHYSEYVILARLYAMGERLMAPRFQAHCLGRFTEEFRWPQTISDECVCDLLEIATTEITERVVEDPMTSHIFCFAATRIQSLQKFGLFRQMCRDIPDVGRRLALKVGKDPPSSSSIPDERHFEPEGEDVLRRTAKPA